jgi:type I restriction-modification system DNA methylase subunit
MTAETHSQLANFIWSICNLLRGPYKRNEYRKVILPLTVLRRFDCILASTKAEVLKEHAAIKTKPENIIRYKLSSITGHAFYNLSKLDLPRLLDDPNQLAPNLNSYINGFSPNVRAIMERFDFGTQIAKMAEKDLLYLVINTTEFKSTLRVNLHTNQPDPKIEHAALKTIAAFLNSREGGVLVIGVKDDGEALGVEVDGFPNEDKMNLHLVNLIKARLGAASMLNIKPHFEDYKGKRLLVVDCLSSSSPVYLKNGNIEEFYIRAGASSAALTASEMTNYIQQRYN